jgi:hypothetical protein
MFINRLQIDQPTHRQSVDSKVYSYRASRFMSQNFNTFSYDKNQVKSFTLSPSVQQSKKVKVQKPNRGYSFKLVTNQKARSRR